MSKILAFAGSNSKESINKKLVSYTASLIKEHEVEYIKLEDFLIPLFCIDLEVEKGIPKGVSDLREKFLWADGFLISSPEYNSSIPGFFKNIIDWISRADEGKIFNNKPLMLMSTSPGGRGGTTNRENLEKITPYWGASSVISFGFGKFYDFYNSTDKTINDEKLNSELKEKLSQFLALLT